MHRIDHDQAEARALVEQLHATADTFSSEAEQHLLSQEDCLDQASAIAFTLGPKLRQLMELSETARLNRIKASTMAKLLRDAAVLLDSYQSGHALATPHHLTGFALVPVVEHINMPEAA